MSMHAPTLWRILSDAARVIAAHRCLFAALSLLFLLPNSIASIIYTLLSLPTSLTHSYSDYQTSLFSADKSPVVLPIVYILCSLLFSLCASISITFTAFHGFRGDPVTFISSLKSIPTSFLPLLATVFAIQIFMWLIVCAFMALLLLVYKGISVLGFEMDYNTNYFLIFVMLMSVLLMGILIYLQTQWSVSTAVVVVESKWGFAPLKRSWYLVKGMRGVVLSLVLLFAVLVGLLFFWYYSFIRNVIRGGLNGWGAVQMVLYACLITFISLYSLAANAVLYVYGRDLHGETAKFQGDEEMGREYVQLPFDEGVAHYVYRS